MPRAPHGLGACYTWSQECYPPPDPCGDIQFIQAPPVCPPTVAWFWLTAVAIALAGAMSGAILTGGKR